ncbi:malto-oligosyltrehalose synthase [Pedobacter sp. PWIIR3]
MFNPQSTYRIQFHADYTFKHLKEEVDYLKHLGIRTLYASPIFQAAPGSMHGYDGTDPNQVNPELGTLDELKSLSAALKSAGISWIQDIVPNHMAFHHHNKWLMDVLKYGETSAYRKYFDIISEDLGKEPIMAPFLGTDVETAMANEDLVLTKINGEHFLKYHESLWPLREDTDLNLPIQDMVSQQYYRLCNYQESHTAINYRRFFTVNSLICLNIQNENVFNEYHRLTRELLVDGTIQGIRIDHVDGLYDPTAYLYRLRELCGPETYIVVEKILEPGEVLPQNWPVQGTTGYDHLGLVNQLFTNQKAEKKFNKFYKNLGHFRTTVPQQVERKKREFLQKYMQGELENLYQLFLSYNKPQPPLPDNTIFRELIAAFLIACPVYRFYNALQPLAAADREAIDAIFDRLKEEPQFEPVLPYFRKRLFAGEGQFFLRLMQFTGPLMAKGVEDTLMYTFNRFIGSNEVGDSPERFGISAKDFHEEILERQHRWPLSMNASATHDTKRGEDARARLNVLTDLKGIWLKEVADWKILNADEIQHQQPNQNDEYFIYQSLIAAWPDLEQEQQDFAGRFLEYTEKALREAKDQSNWDEPDQQYEADCKRFISVLLDQKRPFWSAFQQFNEKVAALGKINSLAALIIKHGTPGIPDTYQGSEFWDLSFVDPDNRRPVDYELRNKFLKEIEKDVIELPELWRNAASGKIKLFFLNQLLQLRNRLPDVFEKGTYQPLEVSGKYSANVFAFARRYQNDYLIFAVPLNFSALNDEIVQPGKADWEDTSIVLPDFIAGECHDCLKDLQVKTGNSLRLGQVFDELPFAVLHFKKPAHKRSAGILLHVSSLPSPYGIGDFGPSASSFLSFLAAAGQKYWQLLPMNPLAEEQSYSPYSATSVMAGNVLLISPDLLLKDGLLDQADLDSHARKTRRKVSFELAEQLKQELLTKAWQNFRQTDQQDFEKFCAAQAGWLDDDALYQVLKKLHSGRPWFDWPKAFKQRSANALTVISETRHEMITEIKWQQYQFFRQWAKIRQEAAVLNIQLIGDMPFYAALDSADVWANPQLFQIDNNGKVLGVAGVPPDYFNADGQMWGMPVYNWSAMAKQKYRWWIQRIERNIALYDLVRLDHFRAFVDYWEIPAQSESAKSGSWKSGPSTQFFNAMVSHFGQLPFIAEDLGEITPEVFQLRDQFALPGMKVLQFAFGEDLPESIHAPHNYNTDNCIVYTGTHDNNTTLGWYLEETDLDTRTRLSQYIRKKVSKSNVNAELIAMAYASVAKIAIIPMQDLLNKDGRARMNTPASVKGNWMWRLKPGDLNQGIQKKLHQLAELFGR